MTTLSRLWIFVLTLCSGLLALALVLLSPEAEQREELKLRAQLGQASASLLLENQAYQLVAAATRVASDAVLQSSLDEMERGQSELEMLHKTAQGRLRELVRGISAAFVLVTDGRGRVLARIGQDEAVYRDALDGWPVLAQALRGYRLDDLWLNQGTLLRVAGSPVIAAGRDRYIGAVVIGQVVGSDLAQAVHAATALDAVFVCNGRAVGGSRALPEPLLAELLRIARPGDAAAVLDLVRAGGPAEKAGLSNGDVLVAIDGLKVNAKDAARQIKAMAGGSRHVFTLLRGSRLLEKTVVPVTGAVTQYRVSSLAQVSYEQKLMRQGWLGFVANSAGGATSNDALREAALRLFTTDPTLVEDAAPTTTPAAGKKKQKKAKSPGKAPAKAKAPAK